MVKPNTQACIAAAAGWLISGKNGTSVFDYSQSKHISIGGNVTANNVQLFDYDRQCHFSGSVSSNSVTFYDFGESQHFNYTV